MRGQGRAALGVNHGGWLGAVPGGPQKGARAVRGRRPPVLAPFVPATMVLVSDANADDPEVVRSRDRRPWGILARRFLELQARTLEAGWP